MSLERTQSLAGRILSQFGLSARLLLLTVLFVMIAEVLIYVPSIANFRLTWLNDRLAAARIAAMVLDAAPEESLPEEMELRLLQGVGARAIALRGGGRRRPPAPGGRPPRGGHGGRPAGGGGAAPPAGGRRQGHRPARRRAQEPARRRRDASRGRQERRSAQGPPGPAGAGGPRHTVRSPRKT